MDKRFDVLSLAAEKLKRYDDVEVLNQLKDVYSKGCCFIAFVGQFSAGKSYLINNLLNRDVLPHGITETTPLLTYIKYGINERAILVFNNGEEKEIALTEVRNVVQNNNVQYNLDEVNHIEIMLENDLLKNGLVLLDTPGINTLVQKHEALLQKSMILSSNIFYVTGKGVTKFDVERMNILKLDGFKLNYVRTHCDLILQDEENPRDAMASELAILNDNGLSAGDCYFVSNNKGTEWYDNIENIRKQLHVISCNLKEQVNQNIKSRLDAFGKRYLDALKELEIQLEAQKNHDQLKIKALKENCESQIKCIDIEMNEKNEAIRKKVASTQDILNQEVGMYIDSLISKSVKTILDSNVECNEEMSLLLESEKKKIYIDVNRYINNITEPIVEEINGSILLGAENIGTIDVPVLNNVTELYIEQDDRITALRELLVKYKNMQDDLVAGLDSTTAQNLMCEIEALKTDIKQYNDEMSVLGEYVPQYVEEGGSSTGRELGKTIGNVADWVLLFLPIPGTEGQKAAKAATVVSKAAKIGKAVNYASKIKKAVGVAQKAIEISEKTREALEAAQKGLKVAKEQGEDSPLRYFTLEHWGGVIGSNFDSPPVKKENEEYKALYKEARNNIESNLRASKLRMIEKKKELGLFKNEIEARQAEIEALKNLQVEVEADIKKQEYELKEKARKNCLVTWKYECAEYFKCCVDNNLKACITCYVDQLDERVEFYIHDLFSGRMDYLKTKKEELERISEMSSEDIVKNIDDINDLVNQMQLQMS